MMPVEKDDFVVDLAPVLEASRKDEAINDGSPGEVAPVDVGARIGYDSADNSAPCYFCLFLLSEVHRQCQAPNSSFHRI